MPPPNLTQRLEILFALLAAMLLVVAATYSGFSWHTVKRDKIGQLRNLAALGAASAESFLQRYSERATLLADDLRDQGAAADPQRLQERLARYRARDPNLAAIFA